MIRYVTGDATAPIGSGPKLIAHLCNDKGAWGSGFVVAISRRWPEPEAQYRRAARTTGYCLGAVLFSVVAPELIVANMIAQRGFPTPDRPCAVDYTALDTSLSTVFARARGWGASVHLPRIGTGIAGGRWQDIEPLILRYKGDVPVTVYDLPTNNQEK